MIQIGRQVHYQGWKSRWDEWLPQDKVHDDNEESRILQVQTYSAVCCISVPSRLIWFRFIKSKKRRLNDEPIWLQQKLISFSNIW